MTLACLALPAKAKSILFFRTTAQIRISTRFECGPPGNDRKLTFAPPWLTESPLFELAAGALTSASARRR